MEGSTVTIEIANKVNCVVCGKERYSMSSPYVCHDCWKNEKAGAFIAELQCDIIGLREANILKDQEISSYQERIELLEEKVRRLEVENVFSRRLVPVEEQLQGFGE